MQDTRADIVVMSIIPKVELKAILKEIERCWPSAIKKQAAGSTFLYSFTNSQGWDLKMAVRAMYEAGNLDSALETLAMLARFRPELAFLCGIAGNMNHTKCNLGDVVVSGSYGYKRFTRMSEGRKLEATMPSVPNVSRKMHDLAQRIFTHTDVEFEAGDASAYLKGYALPEPTHLQVGKIFCWDLVLDCDETRRDLIREDREYRAVEMEAAGFFKAIHQFHTLNKHPVDGLVFRGLSDQASGKTELDTRKDVEWRGYAARNAARALVSFVDALKPDDCKDMSF